VEYSKQLRVTLITLLFTLSACGGSQGTGSNGLTPVVPRSITTKDTLGGIPMSSISILLTDAPPRIGNLTPSAVNIGIDSVAVISNGVVTTLASYPTPYVVNVMAAQTDPSSIGIGDVFNGAYQKLRFVVDVQSSGVVANGITYPLDFLTDTRTQSTAGAGKTTQTTSVSPGTVAMTVTAPFTVGGDPAKDVIADFNALESIAQRDDGSLVARPTLFAVPTELAGKIAGTVLGVSGAPVSGATIVALDKHGRVANTVDTDTDGTFTIHTIKAGTYHIVVFNNYTTASGQQLSASGQTSEQTVIRGPLVHVTAGATAQVGTIQD